MSKNLVMLLDGTGNNSLQQTNGDSASDPTIKISQESTNIARMWPLLEKSQKQQLVYQRGVATDGDWGDAIDHTFGKQVPAKVDEALSAIRQNAERGDRLFLFGFSRGAATARLVAIELESDPLIQNNQIEIPFMGIFDTVASMGFPGLATSDTSYMGYRKQFHDRIDELTIPGCVQNVVHLIAMHEDRSIFAPTFAIAKNRSLTNIKEVWMGGNHGDIGGGWDDSKEDDKEYRRRMISLHYMLNEAKSHQLRLNDRWEDHPDVKVDKDLRRRGKIHDWKDYSFADRIHGTMVRSPHNLPSGVSTPIIHPSALQ